MIFYKKKAWCRSYGSSKLGIPYAHHHLVLFLRHRKDLSEKLSKRVLLFNQGCFSFNFKQFQGKLRDYIDRKKRQFGLWIYNYLYLPGYCDTGRKYTVIISSLTYVNAWRLLDKLSSCNLLWISVFECLASKCSMATFLHLLVTLTIMQLFICGYIRTLRSCL